MAVYWGFRDAKKALVYLHKADRLTEGYKYLEAVSKFYHVMAHTLYDTSRSIPLITKSIQMLEPFDSKQANYYKAKAWHTYGELIQSRDHEKGMLDITR